MTFFFEETSFDRVVTLAGWYITPSYPGAVLVPASEGTKVTSAWVQTLVDHISHLKLQLKDKPGLPRRVGDVFIKCSFAKCDSIKHAFKGLQKAYRKDCCPFMMDISHIPTTPSEDGQGFIFLLHNHHTIDPVKKVAEAATTASGPSSSEAGKSESAPNKSAEKSASTSSQTEQTSTKA